MMERYRATFAANKFGILSVEFAATEMPDRIAIEGSGDRIEATIIEQMPAPLYKSEDGRTWEQVPGPESEGE